MDLKLTQDNIEENGRKEINKYKEGLWSRFFIFFLAIMVVMDTSVYLEHLDNYAKSSRKGNQ